MRFIICLFFFTAFSKAFFAQTVNIIPQPASLTTKSGSFSLSKSTVLIVPDDNDKKSADFLNSYLKEFYGFQLAIKKQATKNAIRVVTKKFVTAPDNDAYTFESESGGITISGDTYAATFYGIQTLIQLLPVQKAAALKIPAVSIADQPRFSYRGLHLDVGRHFFPVSFLKKYIDYIALHKMNYFHWHLTEDQGWRIEIKKYPKLTSVGAWRNGTIIGRYPGKGNDSLRYGGFYTQEEVKEVVAYAVQRFITVVPEIEMPGHSSAAIAAYPELSCFPNESTKYPKNCVWSGDTTGKNVQQTWGVFDDVFCAGKENTFRFLEDVLNEVLPLFPSQMVHVGGDECPKANWKRCPNCQKRMKENNLKDEHELQSYFIQRMEKYLNSKGKKLIGWDEILEGGLAPNAAVMSWRGEEGGIAAAKQNHDVVMTPGGWVYFDHSQSQNEDSVTIGGYTPLDKTYSYEPVPAVLSPNEAKHILGAQANLWTEYVKNPRKAEYMLFPRISALSEVLWSPKEKKNWTDFEKRMQVQFKRYDLWKVNYSRAYFDMSSTISPLEDNTGVSWKLETKQSTAQIYYKTHAPGMLWTIRATDGTKYTSPIKVTSTISITAWTIAGDKVMGNPVSQKFLFNKATGKKITLTNPPSKNYPGNGAFTLVDGVQNEKGLARSKEFLGFEGADCEAIIDLGKANQVKEVIAHVFEQNGSWIYRPASIEAFVSDDGTNFKSMGKSDMFIQITPLDKAGVSFAPVSARYIKIIVRNFGLIGDGNPGAGHKAWLFVDEIEVN